jgi:hypothetical protein
MNQRLTVEETAQSPSWNGVDCTAGSWIHSLLVLRELAVGLLLLLLLLLQIRGRRTK